MLVEFSVANFRSIKDRQTLSLVPGSSAAVRQTKSFATGIRPIPYLLRSVALYGANGSGKTSLVKAMGFLRRFVIGSAHDRDPGTPIDGITPYALSKETRNAPSEFEIIFTVEQDIYQLGFTLDRERVWAEWLFYTPRGRRTVTLIDREYDPLTKEYKVDISATLRGPRSVWKASTRPDALLISTAVGLNSIDLKRPVDWLREKLNLIGSDQRVDPLISVQFSIERKDPRIIEFLLSLGLDIAGFSVERADIFSPYSLNLLPKDVAKIIEGRPDLFKGPQIYCKHLDEDGFEIRIPFEHESDGTQALISLAGPWIDVADRGMTLIVDELHNNLHPFALTYLLENYFTASIGAGGGQLVFTTHDSYPMNDDVLHRDQIWLVDRKAIGGTKLMPLSDYKARSNEPYRTGYLRGRFGGVPITGPRSVQPQARPVDGESAVLDPGLDEPGLE